MKLYISVVFKYIFAVLLLPPATEVLHVTGGTTFVFRNNTLMAGY